MNSREISARGMERAAPHPAQPEQKPNRVLSRKLDNLWRALAVTAQLMGCAHPHFEKGPEVPKAGERSPGDGRSKKAPMVVPQPESPPRVGAENIDAKFGLHSIEIPEDDPGESFDDDEKLSRSMSWKIVDTTLWRMVEEELVKDGISKVELTDEECKKKGGVIFFRAGVEVTRTDGQVFRIAPDSKWRNEVDLTFYLIGRIHVENRRHQ